MASALFEYTPDRSKVHRLLTPRTATKVLKEMTVLNGHLQKRLDAPSMQRRVTRYRNVMRTLCATDSQRDAKAPSK